ncbi:hypothetical protein O5175_07995 [Escherichia coli]|nr:hypothetical protein [Escherichia coli]
MATSQAIIDLSAIPVPDAVEVPDTAVLVTQIVTKYQELDTLFSALVESDPAYKWAEALAFRVALMRQQVNDAVRGYRNKVFDDDNGATDKGAIQEVFGKLGLKAGVMAGKVTRSRSNFYLIAYCR